MKLKVIALALLSSALFVCGQGTIVVDQQATNSIDGFAAFSQQPMGQIFTPSQSSMDVAAFYISTGFSGPVDVEVNVRSGSITGTILGTSADVIISDGGVYDFLFSSPIFLTPGTQYYLQPIALTAGSDAGADLVNAPIPTGGAIENGSVRNDFNFWYQEGTVVPEPSLVALLAIGGVVCWRRRKSA